MESEKTAGQMEMFAKQAPEAPQDPETYADGVKLILARMDTNPEEFSTEQGPWASTLIDILHNHQSGKHPALTRDEIKAIGTRLHQVSRDNFSAGVLKTLARANDWDKVAEANTLSNHPNMGILGMQARQNAAQQKAHMQQMLNQQFQNAYQQHQTIGTGSYPSSIAAGTISTVTSSGGGAGGNYASTTSGQSLLDRAKGAFHMFKPYRL